MTAPYEVTELTRPYWESLEQGVLKIQQCRQCGNQWLPARASCPACLTRDPEWIPSSGKGRVLSWVVYHHAYAEHLKSRIPYDVTLVELEEGARLLTNIVDADAGRQLSIGAAVELNVEYESGQPLARFRLQRIEE